MPYFSNVNLNHLAHLCQNIGQSSFHERLVEISGKEVNPTTEVLLNLFRRANRFRNADTREAENVISILEVKLAMNPGALQQLTEALEHPDQPSPCLPIARNESYEDAAQTHDITHLLVTLCRLWRWPNLRMASELQTLSESCIYPISTSNCICLNPLHYAQLSPPQNFTVPSPHEDHMYVDSSPDSWDSWNSERTVPHLPSGSDQEQVPELEPTTVSEPTVQRSMKRKRDDSDMHLAKQQEESSYDYFATWVSIASYEFTSRPHISTDSYYGDPDALQLRKRIRPNRGNQDIYV